MPDSDPDPLFGNPASDLIRGALEGGTGTNPGAPWQPPAPEVLESLLPQYEIERMLGRGGMGAVYKGRQLSLDRPVAVKILSSHLAGTDPSFVERFKNEARAMAKLSHPGIVAVYDFGEAADGLLYIVMEFVEGTDVHAMIARQGRLHSEHAMAITAHVCDALAYAHERGIIHRDIKPANIMLRNDGVVKVADFGLAKFHAEGRETQGLTRSGVAMGTPHFVAPEALILGTTIDHRADIYAVGVMLYQMLTGKLPQGLFELPSLQIPGLDPRYDGIIGRALREDREVRYPSVQDMRRDLDAILTQPVVKVEAAAEKAPAALPPRSRPQPSSGKPDRPAPAQSLPASRRHASSIVGFAMVCLIVLASAAAFYFLVMDRPAPTDSSALTPPGAQNGMSPLAQPPEATPSSTDPVQATKDQPFVNSLGMKFVPMPGTDILMCIHETRKGDYATYAAQNANIDETWKNPNYRGIPVSPGDDHPVCNVSWDDAKSFCAWLGRKEGLIYRLPTDREWSAAVGIADSEPAGKTPLDLQLMQFESGVYPWGTEWPPPKGAGNFSDITASQAFPADTLISFIEEYSDGYAVTSPVMNFRPNALGLFDLAGNVYELCEDWTAETKQHRVVRGTSWKGSLARGLLSSNRGTHRPTARIDHHGFRVVIEQPMNPAALKAEAAVAPVRRPAALSSGQTTWTDTKGRSLTATFKTIASGNVLLEIAGKITPVPLNTLSAESQRLARELDAGDPAKAAKDKPFVNSLGMKFVPVPGTEVLMCIHETRKADYAAFFAATPGVPDFWQNPIYEGEKVSFANDHPVCNIRWEDCRDFCQWLSRKEGRNYRLPTDREWSFAAGIGDREDAKVSPHLLSDKLTGEFPWGQEWPPPAGAGNLGDTTLVAKFPQRRVIPGYTDGFATTAPVMSFTPNRFGLHDLSGNVWEFCEDWYDDTHTTHVIRGLNFDDGGDISVRFLSSHRGWCPAPNRHPNHGFRVVLERPAKTDAAASGGGDSREDPAMTELLDFERTLRSHTWLIPERNWELRFENDHRASIDERVYTTRWHWWVTGPRSLHVQFAASPPSYDPSIGFEYIFDREMKSFTTSTGKPTGVRRSALKAPEESDLGRSFAPEYAKKLGSSLRPQFPSR
ncbi:MAG: SUMF1/EgtB/PvdO family nonheme iron enzyme [Prosthecobacter sp.]|jgi:serine/threonine protein kinase/formylglycine-generating enzyme required for sulfatase activity|uniref:bifunctional serine/threonine-protein kinase/formylglycine-generating enzyme family protein n=1 Tax=Prosthecobacter sp. TaxID=1965333 RepID=UPI0019EB5D2D|nr:bifunctional serine/threonine-protein kinase/formylglycine-generating enzyme family protein [Prosthecobacter sp.]MBE2284020.1 SUMF1/EgtB/PvdO family nonheme iron enzyme [Prosthecobacter sp.]